ncbi:hypothetical protein LEM8419_03228 [Neolewinella maritima]|uniref:Peptidase M56 domain-containing protein n=1 Tax=Neolewinella maritima TaxID=1383882 RepID=A0ABN8FDA2_9BACT|nr:M56 family metallopeptidase [Neolewinella maritima]CAH1002320.1 hypothetical protein LEM8419_03228 [Neolewinella maritima]
MAEITALGTTLLHSLWQATLLALLLWGVSRYGTLSAAGRYRTAYGALLLQLALSAATFAWYYTPTGHLESSMQQYVIAYVGFPSDTSPAYDRFTDPDFWMTALVACWLIAVFVGALRLAISFWRVRRMQRSFRGAVPEPLRRTVQRLADRLGYRGPLHLRTGEGITGPMLVGHLKPILLLPIALVNQLTTEETETVILHELAHLRRYDHYFNLLQCLIEVLFYYHPAVHWIGARIREEREHCCDDLVLAYGPGKLPYARALLHYGEQAASAETAPATVLSLTDGGGLLARVRRFIHHQERNYTMNNRLFLLPLLALLCLIATAVYTPQLEEVMEPLPVATTPISAPALPAPDTLPPGTHEVTRISNGKVTKLKVADREIQELEIDGQAVPPDEFEENEALAEELLGVQPPAEPFRFDNEWHFDFPPDSLHRIAERALASVGRAKWLTHSLDSLQWIANQALESVDMETMMRNATADTSIVINNFEGGFEQDTFIRLYMNTPRELISKRSYLMGIRDGVLQSLRQQGITGQRLRALQEARFSDEAIERLNDLRELRDLQEELEQHLERMREELEPESGEAQGALTPNPSLDQMENQLGALIRELQLEGIIDNEPVKKLRAERNSLTINDKTYGRNVAREFEQRYRAVVGSSFSRGGSITLSMPGS